MSFSEDFIAASNTHEVAPVLALTAPASEGVKNMIRRRRCAFQAGLNTPNSKAALGIRRLTKESP
jgi:hypothetical protein